MEGWSWTITARISNNSDTMTQHQVFKQKHAAHKHISKKYVQSYIPVQARAKT